MKKLSSLVFPLLLLIVLALPFIVSAAPLLDSGLIAEAQNCGDGGCSLNTFLKLGLNVASFILGIVGALTLLMFVYGGVTLLISGGSADKVKKGKDIILGSVVGLVIVFSSYMIVQFVTTNILQATFKDALPTDTNKNKARPCRDAGGTCVVSTACVGGLGKQGTECSRGQVCCVPKEKTCATAGGSCKLDCGSGESLINGVCGGSEKCCKSTSGSCASQGEGHQCKAFGACQLPSSVKSNFTCDIGRECCFTPPIE